MSTSGLRNSQAQSQLKRGINTDPFQPLTVNRSGPGSGVRASFLGLTDFSNTPNPPSQAYSRFLFSAQQVQPVRSTLGQGRPLRLGPGPPFPTLLGLGSDGDF